MSKNVEDLEFEDSYELKDLDKPLEQEEVVEKEQENFLEKEEGKSEELDAKGERVKAMLRRKKLEEMASKYTDTFYDNFRKHIKEIDKDIKPETTKKPNIIKRFFSFIKRLFVGKNQGKIEELKETEPKKVADIDVKKQAGVSLEDMEKYSKEIDKELQQAVKRDRTRRGQKIEELNNEQQNKDIKPKL